MSPGRAADLVPWFRDEALALWRGAGRDRRGFGVFEALDHEGRPLPDRPKRLRVQARQVFVFATAARLWGTPDLVFARELFEATLERGFDPGTGALASLLSRDGAILDAPNELYDVAFMLLADAALRRAGVVVPNRLDEALARLKAARGWRERLSGAPTPRGQNAHMHLFEASLAQVAAGRAEFLEVAEECLGLFREVFLRADGAVLEFFDEDWRPAGSGQRIEPGHAAEWISLLDLYERATGRASGVDLAPLWRSVEASRDEASLLPDAATPRETTRRLWPQTEWFKAARVAARRLGAKVDLDALPFAPYLATPTAGGWFDRLDEAGRVASSDMPASSAYHVALACAAEIEHHGCAAPEARPDNGRSPST